MIHLRLWFAINPLYILHMYIFYSKKTVGWKIGRAVEFARISCGLNEHIDNIQTVSFISHRE